MLAASARNNRTVLNKRFESIVRLIDCIAFQQRIFNRFFTSTIYLGQGNYRYSIKAQ